MELIFYKAKGGWLDSLIRWWTWGHYSHVELRFEDHLLFSSSWRDGGVRFRDVPIKPTTWDRFKINIHPQDAEELLEWCARRRAVKYDWFGCLGVVIGKRIDNEDKWYCSEICSAGLDEVDVCEFPRNVSPSELFELVVRRPDVFTFTEGPFEKIIPGAYVEEARELALDLLSMHKERRLMLLLHLKDENRVLHEVVMGKIRQLEAQGSVIGP